MGERLKVVLLGHVADLEERLRASLTSQCSFVDSETLEAREDALYILSQDWQHERANVPSGNAVLVLVEDPWSLELTNALLANSIHGVADLLVPSSELYALCRRSWNQCKSRQALQEQTARYLEAIEILNGLDSQIVVSETRGKILETAARTACKLSKAHECALLLADRKSNALLHIHSLGESNAQQQEESTRLCVESYMRTTGRALDESNLSTQRTHQLDTRSAAGPFPELEIPLKIGGIAAGTMLVRFDRENMAAPGIQDILELTCSRTTDALSRLGVRQSEERRRLGLMVESMADGLIMTELERDEVLINPSARRLLKIDSDTNVTQAYLKDKLGFYPFDLVAANPDTCELLREELSIGDKTLHSMVSPVREQSGALIGVVVVLRDFTEAHALAHRQQEFVAIVSHELRSPLTSISGALEIALSEHAGHLNTKQTQYLGMARDSCTKLSHIVDDLLDVARAESGGMPIHIGAVELNRLAQDALEKYRPSAQAKQIELRFKPATSELHLAGDPDRLTQVLNNLFSNALKFTPLKGRIEVEVFGPPFSSSHVGVSVSNNGDSIDEEAQERIFEKFEQVKGSSTRRVGGTGLGLAISRSIIEAHGGRIWVESSTQGAKFVFTLPARDDATTLPLPDREFDSTLVSAPRSGKRVLLVDADAHSSYILKGILMSAGHEVFVAGDSDTALAIARKRLPPLIIVHASAALGDAAALIEILKHDSDTRKSALLALASSEETSLNDTSIQIMGFPVSPTPFKNECSKLIQEAGSAYGSRVLVVEDDPAIRTICAEVLRQAGMTVREAANGLACLTEAKRFRPDVFLLDIMMPDLDGFETAKHLKADTATALTPIIFLSARSETADKVKAFQLGAEDYIVKPFVAAELVARVKKSLERSNRELGASPTTQLPGGGAIEAEFEARLTQPGSAFCYLDLDNMKAYNDYYSYAKADSIIRQTGDLIRDVVARHGASNDFIGHIAGDDFVFITTLEHVDLICSSLCEAFDRLVPLYYDKHDRQAGFIETKDRYGEMRKFPLMTVSIAAITGDSEALTTYSELASAATLGKKLAKGVVGSCYVRNGKTIVPASG